MPYSSQAQRRLFHAKESRGEIKPSVVKEFDTASKGLNLPEHVSNTKRMIAENRMKK